MLAKSSKLRSTDLSIKIAFITSLNLKMVLLFTNKGLVGGLRLYFHQDLLGTATNESDFLMICTSAEITPKHFKQSHFLLFVQLSKPESKKVKMGFFFL